MMGKMYIVLIRPNTGSKLALCQWYDPHDAQSMVNINDCLAEEFPDWHVLEIMV